MTLIRKILIANRGEIACRIIRTCREMGIATVAVYSDADARALHVEMADEAIHIGANPAPESYLNGEKIIAAARRTGSDAVHPGYGFLAENADFAQTCVDAGLIFIGPPPSAIAAMGKKRESKLMLRGIPLVPGYNGEDQSDAALVAAARDIGYPIMVKASASGGGKGMRQVDSPEDLPTALETARREAKQAFGDDTLILERVVREPRHIEVQIFGDKHGNVIALGERECTIQRRHQKIIEETPSTALTPSLRAEMFAAAASIGTQLGYTNAGTVEFLLDDQKHFYFMEMNTRLQVEHPITEETTGFDLVRWQIMVAEGFPLPDMDVYPAGHAIEVRIYAEDPANDFLPTVGKILRWRPPEDVRVDTGVRSGDEISVYYDPMVAKIIAYGEHRDGAIRRLDYALSQLQLLGLRSNISFLRRVLTHPDHLAGNITTAFITQHPELLKEENPPSTAAWVAAAVAQLAMASKNGASPVSGQHWRNNPFRPIRQRFKWGKQITEILLTPDSDHFYHATIAGQSHEVQVWQYSETAISLSIDGHRQHVTVVPGTGSQWWVHSNGYTGMLEWLDPLPEAAHSRNAAGSLRAPMPGQIRAVNVSAGQSVKAGDVLVILEAMKMEHRIKAPGDGIVTAIHFQVGQSVSADAALLEIRPLGTT
jgi:acetyl/propionyl-CoA carboxylase alpha subunit